jgi:hypothetical protein
MGAVVLSRRAPTGGGVAFEFRQNTPSATWTINHGLGAKPPIAIYLDSDPTQPVVPDLTYTTDNQIVVTWDTAVTGGATI